MCVMGLWIGKARPWARGRHRLIVGPSFAIASAMYSSSAERFMLFSALAVALFSTRATSRAAACGMNRRMALASSTGLPLIASVTRRAFRVEPRRYLAVAETRIVVLLPQPAGPIGVLAVPGIRGVGRDPAEPVADHVLRDVHRHVLPAVVDGNRVADEVREDHGRARPGLDDLPLVPLVHVLHPDEKPGLDERSLLDRSRHALTPLLRLAMPAAHDQATGRLAAPRPVPHRGLAPGRLRGHARGGLALAATVGMVPRGHRDAPDLRTLPHVARAPGLAEALVLVIQVADLADGRHAAQRDAPHLARRQPDGGVVALLGEELGRRAGGPDDLAALAGDELDVVDRGAQRDVRQRQRVADPSVGAGARDDDVADLEAVGQQDVALFAVAVVEQADPRGAVRVVLDGREAGRHAGLVTLEVDAPVVGLLAATTVADREAALVVPPAGALLGLQERLVRLVGGDLVERRAGHPPTAGRGGLVASQRHPYTPSKNSIFWPGGRVTIALRQDEVYPVTRPRLVPRRFSFGLLVSTLTAITVTFSLLYSSSTAALIWILLAFSWTANVYLPRPDSSIDFSEITGRRMMSAAVRTLTRTPPPSGPGPAARSAPRPR